MKLRVSVPPFQVFVMAALASWTVALSSWCHGFEISFRGRVIDVVVPVRTCRALAHNG